MVAVLCLGLGSANATTFLELQSTYLGKGWFQYQMTVLNDPFFTEADVTELSFTFTNQIDQSVDSTNWINSNLTNSYSNSYSMWLCTNDYPARPYTETFLIRSSETSYRLASNSNYDGVTIVFSLYLSELNPAALAGIISENMIGYASVPCLVPCRPEEADGSPTNSVYDLKLVPDIQIKQLIQTNGEILGVDFMWGSKSTFLLQGTTDLESWTNIAYLWSYPPETEWTTNRLLNNYGQFFRLSIVAGDHTTNLPPLISSLALAPKTIAQAAIAATTPCVTGCQFANGKVVVSLATQAGQTVLVQAVDSHQVVKQTQQIAAQGTSATVSFDAASLPSPVFFQAVAVK